MTCGSIRSGPFSPLCPCQLGNDVENTIVVATTRTWKCGCVNLLGIAGVGELAMTLSGANIERLASRWTSFPRIAYVTHTECDVSSCRVAGTAPKLPLQIRSSISIFIFVVQTDNIQS